MKYGTSRAADDSTARAHDTTSVRLRCPARLKSRALPLFRLTCVDALSVAPSLQGDKIKLSKGLVALADEDPTFRVRTDEESGQTIISGMGELHLEIIVDRLKREFGVDVKVGRPQVSYREAIQRSSSAEGKYIRQSGGRGQYSSRSEERRVGKECRSRWSPYH